MFPFKILWSCARKKSTRFGGGELAAKVSAPSLNGMSFLSAEVSITFLPPPHVFFFNTSFYFMGGNLPQISLINTPHPLHLISLQKKKRKRLPVPFPSVVISNICWSGSGWIILRLIFKTKWPPQSKILRVSSKFLLCGYFFRLFTCFHRKKKFF